MEKMSNLGEVSIDLDSRFEGLLNQILDRKKKDGECLNVEFKVEGNVGHKRIVADAEKGGCHKNNGLGVVDVKRVVENGEKEGLRNAKENRKRVGKVSEESSVESGKNNGIVCDSSSVKESEYSKKRKRECYSSMIKWILQVAKDPCDPTTGKLPESKRWKNYGSEHLWKQILLVREAMLLKRDNSSAQQSIWQNKQMHPAMYEDSIVRSSRRVFSAKESHYKSRRMIFSPSSSSATNSDLKDKRSDSLRDEFWISSYGQKHVPFGPSFQAEVPEWDGGTHESDSKWLGNRIWPLEMKEQNKFIIERERIGKGRQDSCGCQYPGSFECVRFHIVERRGRVKLELGPAFNRWKFDNMGEDVALSWTKEEEKKFNDIAKSNCSAGESFWDQLLEVFPGKGRESLVSYYFNVFLLRHRGYQNRTSPSNIDSDDEEAEFRPQCVKPPGSIFCSPKKGRVNFR